MNTNSTNVLTIDVGNTNIKLAIFNNEEIVTFEILDQLKAIDLDKKLLEYNIAGIVYSASGQDDPEVIALVKQQADHCFLEYSTPMPIRILYETPETLGKDRIAAALGAHFLYPKTNILVVDLGTCVTYEWLNSSAEYLGGNISPGIQMRLDAMHHFTAKLPQLEISGKHDMIGNSTPEAMRNGAITGTQMEIESFIARTQDIFDDFRIIFTGGAAEFMANKINKEIVIDPYLLHRGLYEIYRYNEGTKI